jgi:FkbM family methyltransferase
MQRPVETLVAEAGFNRCRKCRHGYMLYNARDVHIGRSLDLYGEWAESELELLGLFLGPGDTVIDVGANIGTHTVFFASKVGPGGRVVAVEPQRIVFQTLCANVALNGHLGVHARHAAAGARQGVLRVPPVSYAVAGNYGGVSLAGDQPSGGETVPVVTLDALVDQLADELADDASRCKVLKIDVEGMELAVLDGARGLIARAAPLIYLENNDEARSPALIDGLLGLGYHLFWHFSRFFNPSNHFGRAENVFGNVGDINMICARPGLASAFQDFLAVSGTDDTWEKLQRRLGNR